MCRELLQDFLYHIYINIMYIDSTASGPIQIFHQDKTNQRDSLNIPPKKKYTGFNGGLNWKTSPTSIPTTKYEVPQFGRPRLAS